MVVVLPAPLGRESHDLALFDFEGDVVHGNVRAYRLVRPCTLIILRVPDRQAVELKFHHTEGREGCQSGPGEAGARAQGSGPGAGGLVLRHRVYFRLREA